MDAMGMIISCFLIIRFIKTVSKMVPDADFGNVLIGSDLSYRDVEMFD